MTVKSPKIKPFCRKKQLNFTVLSVIFHKKSFLNLGYTVQNEHFQIKICPKTRIPNKMALFSWKMTDFGVK